MLIQPVQPIDIAMQFGENKYKCQMISLSETELELSCQDYLEKESHVSFITRYFRGNAIIREISFAQYCFTYKLEIATIQFQPGLLINTRL